MSEKKLTPRVGDRVIFRDGKGETQAANVGEIVDEGLAWVSGAGVPGRYMLLEALTVVDRESVEWPEGWTYYRSSMAIWFRKTTQPTVSVLLSLQDIEKIVTDGAFILENKDELMAGGNP